MCGISLIVTGVQIEFSSSFNEENGKNSEFCKSLAPEINQIQEPVFTVDDLKAALLRRGPAHLGTQKIFLHAERKNYFKMKENLSILGANSKGYSCPIACHPKSLCSSIESKVVCTYEDRENVTNPVSELHFLGATLQLRGLNPVHQPLKDTYGNLLVYNGEIFGGVHVGSDENDTEILMDALQRCCCCNCHAHRKACYCSENEGHISISEMLSTVKGPWALIYWQARSKTIWFGRDAFGRRSLLVHWPTLDDLRFVLASVSPPLAVKSNSDKLNINSDMDFEVEDSLDASSYWEELSCGVYSIHVDVGEADDLYNETNLVGDVKKHEWTDFLLRKLIKWERTSVDPKFEEFHLCYHPSTMQQHVLLPPFDDGKPSKLGFCGNPVTEQTTSQGDLPNPLMNHLIESSSASIDRGTVQCPDSLSARKVLAALKDSVMRQTTQNTIFQKTLHEAKKGQLFPIALLFSGGLDSMILAALLDQCLNPSYGIDLLNVSFDGQFAPDRISARAGIRELQRISPCRRWNLVEINADLSKLASETMHVISLINPSKTYMDLNIGIALWLAAGGDGWVDEGFCNDPGQVHQFVKYKSEAKILLVGSGADEQCAGYSRHRTKYRQGGWAALEEEMKLDMQRIWKRNLGRDDRCISDNGKEARFPFLDEDVIRTLLEIPLWEVAELDQPVGRGDKKILREVAQLLGLEGAAVLPKRAIQFGSRIARESNRKNFGSNRAANQASAGSVVIH